MFWSADNNKTMQEQAKFNTDIFTSCNSNNCATFTGSGINSRSVSFTPWWKAFPTQQKVIILVLNLCYKG